MPKRIQITRTRPWQTEPKAIRVSRPSRWSNPFVVAEEKGDNGYRYSVRGSANHLLGMHRTKAGAHRQAVDLFEMHIGPMGNYEYDADTLALLVAELRGRDLACWCPVGYACHADVLLELANGGSDA
jgi:hypothetical protein